MEKGLGSEPTPGRKPVGGVTEKFCLYYLEPM
jgi:hypothetical protein